MHPCLVLIDDAVPTAGTRGRHLIVQAHRRAGQIVEQRFQPRMKERQPMLDARVLSPRASAKYADDLAALRRELGADYLLEANIRRGAERIQITAVLTKVDTGAQIWTDTFQAEVAPANIVEVQDRLAGRIAGAIADDFRGIALLDRVADQTAAAPNDQSCSAS